MFEIGNVKSTLRARANTVGYAVIAWSLCSGSAVVWAQTTYEIDCQTGKVCREKSTLLPLRALPRPFSNLYKSKEIKDDNVLTANVKAFSPVYVFAREGVDYSNPAEPKGWYQVGQTASQPLGWMQAKDVMEWRQAIVVSYTHPGVGEEARKPVLMFENKQALESVVGASDRVEQANKLYGQIKNKEKPAQIISAEPTQFINIEDKFYILPVLDFKVENRFDDETRLLQIAAAVPQQRSAPGKETTLQNAEYQQQAAITSTALQGEPAKNVTADVVFVMDLTKSMGPFIDRTKKAAQKLTELILADSQVSKAAKFGIVGYRDSVKIVPSLEFTTKNFSPSLLEGKELIDLVDKEVKETSVDSKDYPEEVYAGIKEALDSTKWRDGLRFLVLVGDASAHEPGHPQDTTGLDAQTVRALANSAGAYTFAIHLKSEKFSADWPVAEKQFGQIAANKGVNHAALYPVDVAKPDQFEATATVIACMISNAISEAQKTGKIDTTKALTCPDKTPKPLKDGEPDGNKMPPVPVVSRLSAPAGEMSETGGAQAITVGETGEAAVTIPLPAPVPVSVIENIQDVIEAALIDYLGRVSGSTPPRDITFWAMDRDLTDPRKKSLDVRLLINRDDLSSLILALERVTDALATAELTQMKFFESLQAILGETIKGQDINFEKARKLAESNLLPKWIESLPYKSAILEMSDEKFEAMTPAERSELEKSLKAKLQFYKDVSEKVDAWKPLSEQDRDANANKVYPLPMDTLP